MKNIVIGTGNQIEFHYFLKDESHSMDAKLLHDCNSEILSIIKNVSELMNIPCLIETVALSEGGLKQVLKFTDKYNARIALLLAVITLLFTIFPPQRKMTDLEKRNLELQNQKLELEIKILKEKEVGGTLEEKDIEAISNEHDIVVSKSHYYEKLESYEKIEKVTYSIMSNENKIIESITINRNEFLLFIREEEKTPEIIDDKAEIVLIAPILIDKKYKWKGLYFGQEIDFFMNDGKFREDVDHRDVSFQAGALLKCRLITRRKIDESGMLKTTSFAVDNVYEITTVTKSYITIAGKIKKAKEKNETNQANFEFEDNLS